MNDYEINKVREVFSRLFVIAVNYKMNLESFTRLLEKSPIVTIIENDRYDEYIETSIENIFYDIVSVEVIDNSYGIYNDAYWSGQNYFDLHYKLDKSFSYIFLKLPLFKMMDIYSIYHEMDFSTLVEYFIKVEKENTILGLLCKRKNCSLKDISDVTSIDINTLKKYSRSDEALYNGSFQNVYKILKYFDVLPSLFVK